MVELIRGQKAKLSDLTPAPVFEVGIQIAAPAGSVVDVSCFGLDADGKLSDDRYFVFYNQKASPCGALLAQGAKGGDAEVFRVELGKLPASIRRMVFTATLDGAGTMAGIGQSHIQVTAGGAPVARFSFTGATCRGRLGVSRVGVGHRLYDDRGGRPNRDAANDGGDRLPARLEDHGVIGD